MNTNGKLQIFADKPEINIAFSDLNYSVNSWKNEKYIITNLSGQFKAGQISAILGPSGAGKTTLLNILAGYKYSSATGQITINNQPRELRYFYKISRYIMQENSLHPDLTVNDSITTAADFKLGYGVSQQRKQQIVTNVLQSLKLTHVVNNKTKHLSGGERKRFTIALELINNPSIIFLDEPTSGLDEQASVQCVSLLKQLAEEGRTVVCSIHSPSPKVFGLFHHVYILSEGQCVFQGQGNQILPYLEKIQLPCPIHYTPIDFFLDVASGEYGSQIDKLVSLTENGKLSYVENEILRIGADDSFSESNRLKLDDIPEYNISTLLQLIILLRRSALQSYRNTMHLKLRCITCAGPLFIISALYYDIGNNAAKIYFGSTYLFVLVVWLMYSFYITPLILFPIELKRIESEYFNRWYNIPAYFFAKSLSVIPTCIFTVICVCVSYPLVDLPVSFERLVKFNIICIVLCLIAEACSMTVAARFEKQTVLFFFGLIIQMPQFLLTIYGYGTPYNMYPFLTQMLIRSCYGRYAVEALADIIYSNRPKLYCPETEIVCYWTSGKEFSKVFGFGTISYLQGFVVLLTFYLIIKVLNFVMLKGRLKSMIVSNY